jgi:hypothetical protein
VTLQVVTLCSVWAYLDYLDFGSFRKHWCSIFKINLNASIRESIHLYLFTVFVSEFIYAFFTSQHAQKEFFCIWKPLKI